MSEVDVDSRELHPRLVELLERETGAELAPHLAGRIAHHVGEVLEEGSFLSVEDYLEALRSPEGRDLLDRLLAVVLVHETFFYRFASQLEAVERELIPRLLERREPRRIRLWSAGCSRGPEAYTLALIVARVARRFGAVDVLGTDLCQDFLDEARKGAYDASRIRDLPRDLRHLGLDEREERFIVREELRRDVRFLRHNLLDDPPEGVFDLIACRNVLIYLRPEERRRALEHLVDALRDDGFLLVGHSESLRDLADLLAPHRRLGLGIYRQAGSDTDQPAPIDLERLAAAASPPPPAVLASPKPPLPPAPPEAETIGANPAILSLEGEYDVEHNPDRLAALKHELGLLLESALDIIVDADAARCLDGATAKLVARAHRVVEARGGTLSVRTSRDAVRRWAERHRLPLQTTAPGDGGASR